MIARRVLTTVTGGELQDIAIGLVERGYDCPELHELAWEPVTARGEAEHLLDVAISRVGLRFPSRADAVAMLLHHYAVAIVSGVYNPEQGLSFMMRDVYWPEVSNHAASEYVGDTHDMQHFVGAYWNYDDLRDSPGVVGYAGLYGAAAFRALDEEVRRIAGDWLTRHPLPPALAL
jgi:hypothetical protein